MVKDQARAMPMPAGAPVESGDQDPAIEEASEQEVAQARGVVLKIVDYIYSDGVADILQQISNGSAKKLGEVAGNLVTNEIALEEEDGNDIDRGIEIEIMAEIVHEIMDLAESKGVIDFANEQKEQAFAGEALTYAINAAVESNDPQVTEESLMNMLTGALGGAPQPQPAGGMLAPMEATDGN